MELPKNLVQMGKPDKTHKIFIEDYVISYIKKWNRNADVQAVGLALYGRKEMEKGQKYYFLYGAADKESIAKVGQEHFSEYEFLAWCVVRDELPEKIFLVNQGKGIEVCGYACFYENNESMLNYMLYIEETQAPKEIQEEKETVQAKPMRGEWNTKEYLNGKALRSEESLTEEKKEKTKHQGSDKNYNPRQLHGLKTAAAVMFLSLCVLGVTTVNSPDKLAKLQNTANSLYKELTDKKTADHEEDQTVLPIEENETEEKTKENDLQDDTLAVQGPAVTESIEDKPEIKDGTDVTGGDQGAENVIETKKEPKDSREEVKEQTTVTQTVKTTESYVIKKGETLTGICLRKYGNISKVSEICNLNNIKNADSIEAGQTILLP